jgi:outer membrane protein assembly factor BamB
MSKNLKYTKQVAIYAAVFTVLVSILLILNYLQIKSSDPLESKSLEFLIERLSQDPGNKELLTEIRQLDLLTRKAYFNSLWQINTGAFLLLFGAIVLVIALRINKGLLFTIEKPADSSGNTLKTRLLSERWLALSGIFILALALLSAFFAADHIKQFDAGQLAVKFTAEDESIEIIEISTDRAGQSVLDIEEETMLETEIADNDDELNPETKQETEQTAEKPLAPTNLLTEEAIRRNHNSFRGPHGNGVSNHRNIPVDWDGASGKNILWKIKIPLHGYNSPVIWGDNLFFSGADNSKRMVYCYNRHTGQKLWEKEVNNIPGSPAVPPKTTEDTGLAAPTMTVDGHRVYALFGTGDIIAFDLKGNRVWAKNLGVPDNHYGHSSSLLIWNQKVFIQYDTHKGSKVLAINAENGSVVWETTRTSDVSWASPIFAKVDGQMQLILLGNPDLTAYNPETGVKLWSVNCMSGEVGPSPAFGGGRVYAANEYATMAAANPISGEIIWQDRYYLPEVSSLLYHDELLYIATTFAVIACFDAATGKIIWEIDTKDGFYSSPVYADGKIYVFDLSGNAYILKPGREANLIASPSLGEKIFATPVFSDGRIYIRGNEHLYCIGNPN